MGKIVRVGDIFNAIYNIWCKISNPITSVYNESKYWFLLLVFNFIIIHSIDIFYDNNIPDCEKIILSNVDMNLNMNDNLKNISECNNYIQLIHSKLKKSKIFLLLLYAYHFLLIPVINNYNNYFFEIYSKNTFAINIVNLLIYFSLSFVNESYIIRMIYINHNDVMKQNKIITNFFAPIESLYLVSEIFSIALFLILIIKFFESFYYFMNICFNLYENKIKNIKIIELPNEFIPPEDKMV